MHRVLVSLAAALAISISTFGLLSNFCCFAQETVPPQSLDEKLLFFPLKYPSGDWKPKDLKFEDVYLKQLNDFVGRVAGK